MTVYAADGVSYVDYTYDEASGKLTSVTGSATEYIEVNSGTTAWSDGWYVVSGGVSVTERIKISGDVHWC